MSRRKSTSFGLESLNRATGRITKKIFKKSDGFLASLILDWPLIVGEGLSKNLSPKKVTFPRNKNKDGTLHLETTSGSQSLMAYHMQPLILQKVNQFFGYDAFHKVTIAQTKNFIKKAPLPQQQFAVLDENDKNKIKRQTKDIEGDDLQDALQKLGEALLRKDQGHEK